MGPAHRPPLPLPAWFLAGLAPWPQEETRPPSWQALLLETGSRTREWKKASLKLRLFFLAIPEVDAAREVVWPGTRGCQGSQTRARQNRLPPGHPGSSCPRRPRGGTAVGAVPASPSVLGMRGPAPGSEVVMELTVLAAFLACPPCVLPIPPCDSSWGLGLSGRPGASPMGAQGWPGYSCPSKEATAPRPFPSAVRESGAPSARHSRLQEEAGGPAACRAWGPGTSLALLGLGSRTAGPARCSLPGVAESCVRRLTPRPGQLEPRAPLKRPGCRLAVPAWTQPVSE